MRIIGAILVLSLGAHGLWISRRDGVFSIGRQQDVYVAAAELVDRATDPSSVLLSVQHSGSLRYYAARTTLRFDALDADGLDRAVDWLAQHGAHPYLLVEPWERDQFRKQFGDRSALGRLEMPPVAIYQSGATLYLYDLLSRQPAGPDPEPTGGIAVPRVPQPRPAPPLVFSK
jgi:hypothetical protein